MQHTVAVGRCQEGSRAKAQNPVDLASPDGASFVSDSPVPGSGPSPSQCSLNDNGYIFMCPLASGEATKEMNFQDCLLDETQKSKGEGRGKQKQNETRWGTAASQGPFPHSPRQEMKRELT